MFVISKTEREKRRLRFGSLPVLKYIEWGGAQLRCVAVQLHRVPAGINLIHVAVSGPDLTLYRDNVCCRESDAIDGG